MSVVTEVPLERADDRRRRRPLWYVVCVGLVCLGAVVSAYAFTRANHSREVVAVASTVRAGETITAEDLVLVEVGADTDLQTVPAGRESSIVGQVAQVDMAAGGVVVPGSYGGSSVPAAGMSVVGLSLTPAQMPAGGLAVGDPVSLVPVSTDSSDTFAADARTVAGTIVGVSAPDASGVGGGGDPQTGNTVVDVMLSVASAPGVAAKAASGNVALVLNSRQD